jgi:group II intron reverse transcriptase/maturase
MMHGQRKSDRPVVPTKPSNKARTLAAEVVEGSGLAKENTSQQNACRTQSRENAPSALERVRQAAKKDKNARFTALSHHLNPANLLTAFWSLKKRAAAGIDGVTWEQYQARQDGNLKDLHARLRTGAYRAKASRRTYIPKADGRLRPLGVAALEDKVVQRVVVEVMNAIYENDFLGFSYGFRPGRNQHQALDALAIGITRKKVNWVFDADIRAFFDCIDHGWLMKFVEHRIADKGILRLIQKWLNAGVMEDGKWTATEEGTPQGATISPLLANIYLHYVYDLWVQSWRKKHARGDMIVTRFADDTVVGFEHRQDAERFQKDLRDRLRKFKLELHPDKTRLIEFGRYAAERRKRDGQTKPETFDFLGLTHICGRSRTGGFLLWRQTVRKRLRAKLLDVKNEIMRRQHLSIMEQGSWLAGVWRGYLAYHGVPTNIHSMRQFRDQIIWYWKRALKRRGQRDRTTWDRMSSIAMRWLPLASPTHPWPNQRFDARIQGKSPVR